MKFQIRHEIRGRMRIHVIQSRMSFAQADTLQYYLEQCESVISAKIQNRAEDVTICYEGSREANGVGLAAPQVGNFKAYGSH